MIKLQYNDPLFEVLEKRLGEEASRAAWDYMLAEGYVGAVKKGERDVDWLIDRVMTFLEAAGKSWLFKGRPTSMLTDEQRKRISQRLQALSVLWAEEAAKEDYVVEFRKHILKERLLQWE